MLKPYEEEILFRMYDQQIIGHKYTSIQTIKARIKWSEITRKHGVRKKFTNIFHHLIRKGYIDDHGKRGKAGSLSSLGVLYVVGKKQED